MSLMDDVKLNVSTGSLEDAGRSEASPTQIIKYINKAIAQSFREERLRGEIAMVSDGELHRRAKICWKWFRIMRFDCGYTAERAGEFLPLALRRELDRVHWEPPAKDRAWSPDVLAKV